MLPKEFSDLVNSLIQCPSITKKQATKIVNFLLSKNPNDIEKNIELFLKTLKEIKECKICKFYSSEDLCQICSSNERDNKLMIVENKMQIQKYEEWKLFNGKYYIVPLLFTKKFERIENNFNLTFLLSYINNFDEIIIGISPTAEGVITSNYIFDTIKKEKPNISISKLAIGVPIGSSIDYMDELTMSYAIKNRKDIK